MINNTHFKTDEILVGDVLVLLRSFPENTIDLTITSPPYNKRNKTHGWLVTNQKYSHYDDHMPEEKYQNWQIDVLNELFRITKPGGSLFYNHKHRWIDGSFINPFSWISKTNWTVKQEIVWDRAIAANMRGWRYWQVDERIYWLYKPNGNYLIGTELESKHAKLSSIWRIRPEPRTNAHPAPYPIELPTRIIFSILNSTSGVVLDPFCGSGTTLVAAKLLGHRYLGIDISPEYVAHAKDRLSLSSREKKRVDEEKSKHLIDDSFVERKKRGTISWPYGPKPKKESLDDDS
jgi:site-specific DNA-methyltransferase (adenine-specific)